MLPAGRVRYRDEPGVRPGSRSSHDTSTGDPPLEHFLLGMDVQDVSPSPAFLAKNVYMGAYGAPYTRGPAQGVHDLSLIHISEPTRPY